MTAPLVQQHQDLDTQPPEDQLSPGRDVAKQAAAEAKSASPRARRAPTRPRPATPPQQQQHEHPSLFARLAAAAALSTFVGALYVSNTIVFSALVLLLTSTFSNPWGWLLLALWLLLAACPLGTGAASGWGWGVPSETHAALTAPAPEFGRSFVRYVTAAAQWYFPVRMIVEGEDEEEDGDAPANAPATNNKNATTLQPDGAYMIGLEPHSVLPLAMPACFSTDSVLCPKALRGQKVHGLASSVCFSVPLIRHLWWFLGIRPVTRRVIARLITGRNDVALGGVAGKGKASKWAKEEEKGGLRRRHRRPAAAGDDEASNNKTTTPLDRRSVVLVPGGVQECLYMQQPHTGVETAFLSNRRGFVRLAMRCGADALVPVFVFGQSHGLSWARPGPPIFSQAFVERISRSLGALPLALWGRWGTPAPHRKPMVVVVGRPLPLPRPDEWAEQASENGDPPVALVQEHLEGYIRAMESLVERHKVSAGFPETTLRVL